MYYALEDNDVSKSDYVGMFWSYTQRLEELGFVPNYISYFDKKILFDIKEPDEPLLCFLGVLVGVNTSTVYIGSHSDVRVIPIGDLKSFFLNQLYLKVSSERLTAAIQAYKLSGNMDSFVERIKDADFSMGEGSFVSRFTVPRNVKKAVPLKESLKFIYKLFIAFSNMADFFFSFYRGLRTMSDFKVADGYNLDYSTVYDTYKFFEGIRIINRDGSKVAPYIWNDADIAAAKEAMYKVSYKENSDFYSHPSFYDGMLKMSYYKIMNLYEVMESVGKDNELVYSDDLKSWIKEIGIDKMVSTAELRSITTAWNKVRGWVVRAPFVNTRPLISEQDYTHRVYYGANDKSLGNSLQMFSKCLDRLSV